MKLQEKQALFAQLVAKLIQHAEEMGYQVTLGEAHRPAWVAEVYAKQRKGIANSLHTERLAIDLNLFRSGVFLAGTEDHRPLGEWWETLHKDARWGGRFKDGGHYSLQHNGRM